MNRLTLSCTALVFVACIGTKTSPQPTPQAAALWGDRVYLADNTANTAVTHCRFAGTFDATNTSTSATTINGLTVSKYVASNCFVKVQPAGTVGLPVDIVEATNDLYQLCFDSGACAAPNPNTAQKSELCSSEDEFTSCPVVNVSKGGAEAFCKFLGRRIPTGMESIMMRQGAVTTTPVAGGLNNPQNIPLFPSGDQPATTCTDARFKPCGTLSPITVGDASSTKGAAADDVTPSGIFDLTGSAAEWATDQIFEIRTGLEAFPWFCTEPITSFNDNPVQVCPTDGTGRDQTCIWGNWDPDGGGPLTFRERPICVTSDNLRITDGTIESTFGGDYVHNEFVTNAIDASNESGIFVRRGLMERDRDEVARGVRCVGQSGAPEDTALFPTTDG